MRRFWLGYGVLIAVGVVFLATSVASLAREADDKAEPPSVEEVDPSAWNPVVRLSLGCTGFYIGEGIFLSAGHCMGKGTSWTIDTDNVNGGKKTIRVDTMIYSAPGDWNGQDTAIIYVDPIVTKDLRPLDLDCSGDLHPIGTEIATEGFPEEYGRNYVVGFISAKPSPWVPGKGGWYKDVYRAQLPVSYGNSGGPILDRSSGKVIGIHVGAEPNNRGLAAFQPIDFACRVMGINQEN